MPLTPRIFVGTATVRFAGPLSRTRLHVVASSVQQVIGVRSVAVDPTAGTLTVVADQPVDRADIAAAVRALGHEIRP